MKTGKIIILSVLGLVAVYAIYKIVSPSVKPDKAGDDKQPKKDEKKYVDEIFPLKKGMKGEHIRKVRAVLGLSPTEFFDEELENTLYSKYGVKQITETDYNFYAQFYTPNV